MDFLSTEDTDTDTVDPANLPLWTDHPELEEARQALGEVRSNRKSAEEEAQRLERKVAERKRAVVGDQESEKARARIERRKLEKERRQARQRVDELILEEEEAQEEFHDVLEQVAGEFQQAADEVAGPILRKFAEAVREYQEAYKLMKRLNAYYDRLNNRYRKFRQDQHRAPITKPYNLQTLPRLDAQDWEQLAEGLEESADAIQ
jgi:DNA repair ATPase RecN